MYLDAQAGPYSLYITVQPPPVIPGVAQVQIRTAGQGVRTMSATPLGLTGEEAEHAPVADLLHPSKEDPQYFTGAVWLMQPGSMQVRVKVEGDAGSGTVSVPLPAIAQRTLSMPAGLGFILFALLCLLLAGLAGIIGAAVTEAELAPGVHANRQGQMRRRIVMGGALAVLILITWLGNTWWTAEASAYQSDIYKPLQMVPSISGGVLKLKITDPGWLPFRKSDDFVPDHAHLMHLYLIRQPELDQLYHLHPDVSGPGMFELQLPEIVPGTYKLYADVVHEDGFPETLTASIKLPGSSGGTARPLGGDDGSVSDGPASEARTTTTEFRLPDGYQMRWVAPSSFAAKRAESFRFELLDAAGHAPQDMQLYMGMLGHAAFVKTDGTVFAHIHPNGTVAMAALMMSQPMAMAHSMSGMEDHELPNVVSFPYGFPSAGHYRIFVQMKHGETVETSAFDAFVKN